MTTPLDELAEYVMGHSREPCPSDLRANKHRSDCPCKGTGKVLDTERPLFKALWEPCPCWLGWESCHKLKARVAAGECPDILWGTHYRSICLCEGKDYILSSRTTIALRLPEMCRQLNLRHAALPPGEDFGQGNEWWIATFSCPNSGHDHRSGYIIDARERTCLRAEANNWLDAVCAVVLMAEKAREVANA